MNGEWEGGWGEEATSGAHPCGHLGATSWENSGKCFTEILRGALLPGARRLGICPPASLGHRVGALPGGLSVNAAHVVQATLAARGSLRARSLGSHCNPRVMDRAPTAPAASFEKAGQAGSLAWKQVELDLRHNEDPKGEATDFRGRLRGGKVVEAPVRLARSPGWILGWAGAVLTNRRRTVLKKHFGPRPRVKPGHTRAGVLRRAHAVLCVCPALLQSPVGTISPSYQVSQGLGD